MKTMGERVLSMLLMLCLVVGLVPVMSVEVEAGFIGEYTLTGDKAKDMVNVALAQKDRTQAEMGYTCDWCSLFIYDCAKRAGATEVPREGYNSSLFREMTKKGYEGHWFTDIVEKNPKWTGGESGNMKRNYDIQYSSGILSSDWVPQVGDIIFFNKTIYTTFCHVAMVQKEFEADGKNTITVIHGNWGRKVTANYTIKRGEYVDCGEKGRWAICGYVRLKPACDHKFDNTGRCYKCKDAFMPFSSTLCIETGLYESITSTALYKYPYLASDRTTGSIMACGIQVVDNNAYRNGIGEIWYRANYNGIEGYVKADTIKRYASLPSTLKVEQPANGYTIQLGSPVDIIGSVSSNYQLSTISATIDGQNYLNPTPITGIKSSGYSLYHSNINYQLKGASLSAGTHELRITATDVSGASKTAVTTIRVNAKQEPEVYAPTIKVVNEHIGGKTIRIEQQTSGATLTYYCGLLSNQNLTTTNSYVEFNVDGDAAITAYSTKNGKSAFYGGTAGTSFNVRVPQLSAPSIQIDPKPDGAWVSIVGDGEIYYSIDGAGNQRYYQPFMVTRNCTISAFSQKAGYQTSWTETETFTSSAPSRPEISLLSTNSNIAVGEAITVRWDSIALASSYTVQASLNGVEMASQTVTTNSATISASDAGTYSVSVTANNAFGSSTASRAVSVTAHDPLTVTFTTDDGDVLSEQSIRYGGDATAPASPAKKGYTFAGWSQSLKGITKDAVITAQYNINYYTVRFYQTDGVTLISSVTVPYGSAVDTTDIERQVAVKHEFNKFAGWHITESDSDSLQSLEFVDSDLVLVASQKWSEASLPIGVNIVSAAQNTDATGFNISLQLFVADESILNPDRQEKNTTVKAKIIAALKSANGRMLASEMSTVSLISGTFETEKSMFISYSNGDVENSYIEVSVVGIDGNDRTGGALSETVSIHPTINGYYSPWVEESELPSSPLGLESKTEYRYTDSKRDTIQKNSTSSIAPYVPGYTLVNTYEYWGSWSDWSDTAVSATNNRQIETRTVVVTAAYTQYRYGAWVYGSKRHFCPEAGKYYYGGTWSKQYTSWQNSPVSPDTSSTLYCAGSSHTHINPDHYDGKGVPNWYRYRIGGNVYYWQETQTIPATTKTQYRYVEKNYRYTYERWTSEAPSEWSDTVYSEFSLADSRRVVETRQVYRYLTAVPTEGVDTVEQFVSGALTGAADDLEGKRATVMVYKQTNSDPTEPQLEYIGQTTIGADNAYSFSFRPKEEPSVETGDYVVALALESCTNVINVAKIPAPEKTHKVRFLGLDGQTISEQDVTDGSKAEQVAAPIVDGYTFVCWDADTSFITHDVVVHGVYWPDRYSVVFVDHENGTVSLKTDYIYGEQIMVPDRPTSDSAEFNGWEIKSNSSGDVIARLDAQGIPYEIPDDTQVDNAEDLSLVQTVREDLIAVALWTPICHQVNFKTVDGSILQSVTVNHGEAAQPPEYNDVPENMEFLGWNTDVEWWNVTGDMDVYPIVAYVETAVMPASNMGEYSEGVYAEVLLEAEENATILYTLDGSDPSFENLESAESETGYIRDDDAPVTYIYDGTLELCSSAFIRAMSVVDGKNDSDIIEIEFIYNEENQGQLDYNDSVELGTYHVVAEPGKIITLSFGIQENPGLLAYAFTVEADPTVFGVVYDEETYEANLVPGTVCADKGTVLLGNYQDEIGWQILWFGTTSAEGNGTLCTIQLQVSEDAEAGKVYPIKVCYSPSNTFSEQDFQNDLTGKVAISTLGNAAVLGDINGDGSITTIDVVRIARYLIDDITFTKTQLVAADVTGDGKVTASDVIRLARYLVGLAELN